MQIDGYNGQLPAQIQGKRVIRVDDAEAWVRARPGQRALHLKLSSVQSGTTHVVARDTWGTGQSWREGEVVQSRDGWEVVGGLRGGDMF